MRENIQWVWLNRPDKKNAVSREMANELSDVVRDLQNNTEVRGVVFAARGDVFCAGADLKERKEMSMTEVEGFLRFMNQVFYEINELPMPTLTLLQGSAFGGGCELSLCTDFRFASDSVFLTLPETSLGIIPGWGGTQRLPMLIGLTRAKQMIYACEKVSAQQALEWGLVTAVYATDEAEQKAAEFMKKVTSYAPLALRQAKQALQNHPWTLSMNEALKFESDCYQIVLHSEDRKEALAAFQEKRSPVFKGH